MKKNRINRFGPLVVALSIGLSLAAGQAVAGVTWSFPFTTFEDDDIDFHYDRVPVDPVNDPLGPTMLVPTTDFVLNEGDVLIAILEIDKSGGQNILPDELTGVTAIQIQSITPNAIDPGIADLIIFKPVDEGLDSILALGTDDKTVIGGGAGGNATAALWLDPTPNLALSSSDISAGTVSCTSLSQCIDQAVDGSQFQVDGFADPDDIWLARNAVLDTQSLLGFQPADDFGRFNFRQSILFQAFGQVALNSISCAPFCGAGVGADGLVDMLGSGTINGGLGLTDGLQEDGAVASSDFQFVKRPIPEPAALMLLSFGLLGLAVAARRKRGAIA